MQRRHDASGARDGELRDAADYADVGISRPCRSVAGEGGVPFTLPFDVTLAR